MDRHSPASSSSRVGHGLVAHVVSRLRGVRRLALATGSRFTNCRFVFALSALAVLGAKVVHIYTHLSALATVFIVRWGYSFFAQDIVLLMILRLLLDGWLYGPRSTGFLRGVASFVGALFIGLVTILNVINICFFVVSGSEIHWRNVGLAGDAAGRALLLSGLLSSILVIGALVVLAWLLQDVLYAAVGLLTDIVSWPVAPRARARLCKTRFDSSTSEYTELPQGDIESAAKSEDVGQGRASRCGLSWGAIRSWPWPRIFHHVSYGLAAVALLAQAILCAIRPDESSLTFMSWTPALLPFVDFKTSAGNMGKVVVHNATSIYHDWDDRTALLDPIPLPWLPKERLDGFEDWYDNKKHYVASADPLRISNLDQELLPELRNLKDVPIRHIMTIVLESTRKDVFPIKNWGANPARLRDSWDDKKLPPEALERLKTLTPTAKYVTGDFDDQFESPEIKNGTARGGLNFNDAYTTSTYTLKSLTGSLCGVMPLTADFNLEYLHHIYQPCLPHIAAALNTLQHDDNGTHGFGGYDWTSTFMQSVTLTYDNFGRLMKKIGFPEEGLIDKEYLQSDSAKFGKIDLPDVNYFGFEETPLEDYIRDQFETAKKNNGRAFITHVTSTSHHPYAMPESEKYVPLAKGLDDLSHYINAIGYDDRWLGKILGFLDDLGVANETLVIFVGDHGLSIPENDILASYYNPNIANNHVPLVFSHPMLPPITIDDAISTQQILPTVLDLLIETGSLSGAGAKAAKDLLQNYEAQSLLRPVRKTLEVKAKPDQETPAGELANWQFTNINPGRAMLGLRDARHKYFRMVVPVVDNVEWRFTYIKHDHREAHPVVGFDFAEFQKQVAERHGKEAARWVEEGAFVARWFVEENSKRWRYGPYEA
ncbi:sulfatase domain-containingprotein [Purpureocillium lavendulum]|uniref:Sulfatase domain-containingprotein n=1 Tax=Purpureocillium lavendulum TaxID=1247861 RepID=A0AB34FYD1_9HYPO|nr:sulfatase domain-containingprotein [Purpureocillium lavendulum]